MSKFLVDISDIILAYHYTRYQKHYDYLIVDHGLCQQLGSILHVNDFSISSKALYIFSKLVKLFEQFEFYYCSLPSEIALERMRNRKRNVGRIDAIMNDTNKAMGLLNKERQLFDRIYNALVNEGHMLDMTKPIEQ